MDFKTESQLRTELARVWEMLDAERAAYATRIAAADKRFDQAQAAIALKVPMSGIPELDDMIRESRRLDMISAAMTGVVAHPDFDEHDDKVLAAQAVGLADACWLRV